MPKPIAPAQGIAFAFPDVCNTPSPVGPIPIPYPNIAMLDQAENVAEKLLVGPSGTPVLLESSKVSTSAGDEAGSVGGVVSSKIKGEMTITISSKTVVYGPEGKGIVRFMDMTQQNDGNAVGVILSSFPTVLVGD